MPRLLLSLLYLGAADALHYVEGSTATTEEVFANGTYSYAALRTATAATAALRAAELPSGRLRLRDTSPCRGWDNEY